MENEDRDEVRKIIEEELRTAAPKKGLVIRRVGSPLGNDELKNVAGGLVAPSAPGDQCCNGCD
jgi:hypothetical protein